jgi:hypothetical protein
MTELLPEFAGIPSEGVLGEELVAFGDDGLPSFDRLSRRILHGDTQIPLALLFFGVLAPTVRTALASASRAGRPLRPRASCIGSRGRLGAAAQEGVAPALGRPCGTSCANEERTGN